MSSVCRLCLNNTDLRNSHIIPKFFFEEVKRNSLTKKMRTGITVNKVQQDGLKTKFLCQHCEELFSKYEKLFSENIYNHYIDKDLSYVLNSDNDELRYFILSIVWRYIQYYLEQYKENPNTYPIDITPLEMKKLKECLNDWRLDLFNKDYKSINNYKMFIIPYDNITSTETNIFNFLNTNSVAPDFSFCGEKDKFKVSLFFLKVPHLIFIFTIWGNYNSLKSNEVGKPISIENIEFDNIFLDIINKLQDNFEKSKQKLSCKQKRATIDRVIKAINNLI